MTSSPVMPQAGRTASALKPSRWLSALLEHSERSSDGAAVIVTGIGDAHHTSLTYRGLVRISARLGGELCRSLNHGDVVMLVAENGLDYVKWMCAALMAGMRVLPVHCGSTAAELCAIAAQSGAAVIIAPDDLVATGALPIRRFSLSLAAHDLNGAYSPEFTAVNPGAILLQSSGTTGTPKIVLREVAALDAVAVNVAQVAQLSPADRVLAVMPLSHSYGVDLLLATLFSGATLHLMPAFDAVAVAEQLAENTTVFPGVPFMFEAISRIAPPHKPARLRLAFSAGTHLPSRILEPFRTAWGCTIGQLYGTTELGSVMFNHPDSPDFDPACVGISMNGVSVRILDPDNHAERLGENQTGHVAISAPSMLTEYVHRQMTADEPIETSVDGHFLTGDLGALDEHGRLFITGRLKLLIDVGGLKVNPLEIEAVLGSHPDVAECVAVPMRLSDIITRIRAVYVPRDPGQPPAPEDLRVFLKQRLSAHKIPRVIECVHTLPRSPSGKLQRHLVAYP